MTAEEKELQKIKESQWALYGEHSVPAEMGGALFLIETAGHRLNLLRDIFQIFQKKEANLQERLP